MTRMTPFLLQEPHCFTPVHLADGHLVAENLSIPLLCADIAWTGTERCSVPGSLFDRLETEVWDFEVGFCWVIFRSVKEESFFPQKRKIPYR